MQTLPDYPATLQNSVRRDATGYNVVAAPEASNTNDSTVRTRPSNQQKAIIDAKNHASRLENERPRDKDSACGDCVGEDNGKLAMEMQYDKMRKETLTAADIMRNGYSANRGQAEDGKFKVYGKNLAAQDFNSMVKQKKQVNKYKSKIHDWSLR